MIPFFQHSAWRPSHVRPPESLAPLFRFVPPWRPSPRRLPALGRAYDIATTAPLAYLRPDAASVLAASSSSFSHPLGVPLASAPPPPPRAPGRGLRAGVRVPLAPLVNVGGLRLRRFLSVGLCPSSADRRALADVVDSLTSWRAFTRLFVSWPLPRPPPPRSSDLSSADWRLLRASGVLRPLSRCERSRWVARAFKVLKSDPAWARFILAVVPLNEVTLPAPRFCIASPRQAARFLAPCTHVFSADGCNWFFQIPLLPAATPLFACRGPDGGVAGSSVEVMGWRRAPFDAHVLTCALSGASPFSISRGPRQRSLVIIDNTMVGVRTGMAGLYSAFRDFTTRARRVNAALKHDDAAWRDGARSCVHGGVAYRLDPLRWRLKPGWAARFRVDALGVSRLGDAPWGAWQIVLGAAVWACRVLEVPLFHLRPLWDELRSAAIADDPHARVALSPRAVAPWVALADFVGRDPEIAWVGRRRRFSWLYTDASRAGWGAALWDGSRWHCAGGRWSAWERERAALNMPWAEGRAALLGLRWHSTAFRSLWVSSLTFLIVDCDPLFWSLVSLSPESHSLSRAVRRITSLTTRAGGQILPAWTPTRSNAADPPSRGLPFSFSRPPPSFRDLALAEFHFPCAREVPPLSSSPRLA